MTYHKVATAADIQDGTMKIVFVGIKRLVVYHVEGRYYCTQNLCPHAGAHLGTGTLKGKVVLCPRHQWGFDIESGNCLTDPIYDIRTFSTRVCEDGFVWVEVPD